MAALCFYPDCLFKVFLILFSEERSKPSFTCSKPTTETPNNAWNLFKDTKKNVGVVLVTLLITCKLTTNMKQVKCVRRRNLKKVLEMRKSTLEVNLSQRKLPRSLVHTRRYIVSLLHTKNQLKLKTLKFLFHRT